MNKILVGVHGRPSIKNVYSLMQNPNVEVWVRRRVRTRTGGIKEYWRVYSNGDSSKYRVEKQPTFNNDTILRWGNEIQIEHPDCIIYNQARAVAAASSKGSARVTLHAAGVSVPEIITNSSQVQDGERVIARPQTHAKGKNLVILTGPREVQNHMSAHPGWYYAKFFPKEREVRAHVAFGKILALMEKPAPSDRNTVAWNRAVVHEEWNAIPWGQYHFNACKEALKAVQALGLDTGGVDVMIRGDEAVVLEVNTAPTLISSPYVSQRYAELLNWLFTPGKKEWIDFNQFKKAQSFSWKHSQLDGGHDGDVD
jgi:hypothetical protein